MSKSNKFKDKAGFDNEKEKSRGSNYGHLILPRGTKMFTVEGGDRVDLDFLPYVVTDEHHPCRDDEHEVAIPGTEWYRRPYKLHRNIGPTNETVVCPTSIGKRCPVCEYRAKLVKEGKANEDLLKSLRTSDRNLYCVVPIGQKEFDEEIHLFDISRFCFQDTLREETDENPEFRAFWDPSEDGFTVSIRFSEEKLGKNKYAAASRIDFKERKDGYDDAFLKKVPRLDDCLHILSYAEIEAKLFEIDAEDAENAPEIDDEAERRNRRREQMRSDAKTSNKSDDTDDDPPARKKRTEDDDEQEEQHNKKMEKLHKRQAEDDDDPPARSSKDDDLDPDDCVACKGTGEDSKGRACPICKGFGKKPSVKEEEPKKLQRKKVSSDEKECPSGHKFGEDCDDFPKHCGSCPLWDDCFDAKEEMKKNK